MQQTVTIPCNITYTHNPEEFATRHEPYVEEEFYIDSFKICGVDLTEFLTDGCENKLYEILKGQYCE